MLGEEVRAPGGELGREVSRKGRDRCWRDGEGQLWREADMSKEQGWRNW